MSSSPSRRAVDGTAYRYIGDATEILDELRTAGFEVRRRRSGQSVCDRSDRYDLVDDVELTVATRCQVVDVTAYRYIGDATEILDELRTTGFEIVRWMIDPRDDAEDQDKLWTIAHAGPKL